MEKVAKAGSGADAYMIAGATLLQLNEYEQARQDLEQALRLKPAASWPVYAGRHSQR